MPRHRKPTVRKSAQSGRFSPDLGSFITGVAFGGATVLLIGYLYLSGPGETGPETTSETAEGPSSEQTVDITFFEVLPDDEVKTDADPFEPPPRVESGPSEYFVQAASFLRRQDAEVLRAELILEGMPVRVASSPKASGGAWHRVLVGPFTGKDEAQQTRNRLREKDMQAAILARPAPRAVPQQDPPG